MSRELLILRHAKSAWDTGAPTDFERPLSPRGEAAAPRVGRWLAEQGLLPDYVVSSPAERAKQTVLAVCGELGFDPARIRWDQRVYGAWPRTLINLLRESPDEAGRVLLAGHNPGLEDLVHGLCGGRLRVPPDGKLMPTGAVARLEIPVAWPDLEPGCAELLSLTRPRDLRQ